MSTVHFVLHNQSIVILDKPMNRTNTLHLVFHKQSKNS
jgi:hypothetical protein